MTTDNGRAFNEWLRAQLKAKKMSQRQLAQQSGVDHSTISRLIRGDRMPTLGTATRLARGLREIREDSDTATALGVVSMGTQNPTARVEYALRADETLTEPQVRQIMEYYLAVRVRRFARAYSSIGSSGSVAGGAGAAPASSGSLYGRPAVYMGSGVAASGVAAPTSARPVPPRYGATRPAVRPPNRPPGRP
jgi:transcriptional regulator with XRE-family HTH domain